MTLEKILLGLVAKQLGVKEEAVAEMLYKTSEEDNDKKVINKDALKTLLDKDSKRVETLKTTAVADAKTGIYNDAYADAKKEILPKAEKRLAEKYGIEGKDFKLDSLVADIVKKETEAVKGDKITEDVVKKHPTYLNLERDSKKAIEKLEADYDTKIKTIQADHAKGETLKDVKGEVLALFDGLKPILPKDVTKANNQRTTFAKKFESYGYEKQTDGSYLVLDAEGKRLEDPQGNPVKLNDLVKQEADKSYEFAVQSPKGGAGNGTGDGASGDGNIEVPKDEDAYNMAILNANSPEERAEITEAYEASQG